MEVFKLRDYSSDTGAVDLLLLYSILSWGVAGRESPEAEGSVWPAALSACEHWSELGGAEREYSSAFGPLEVASWANLGILTSGTWLRGLPF